MKEAIKIDNLSFAYSNTGKKVLNDVSITINYGEITLIAGDSGQGKSTLFYIMNGVIPHSTPGVLQGDVFVDGENISTKSIGQISRKLGSVLQNADSQIINNIVGNEVAFGCENIGLDCKEISSRINYALDQMGLDKNANTQKLSGGEKQKLISATTFALDSKIIVLDEPLANLDKKSTIQLMERLKQLKESGYAIVIIEHRIDMIIKYVDTIFYVDKGNVAKVGDRDFFDNHTKQIGDTRSIQGDSTILQLNDICYNASGTLILKNINLEIHEGERLLVLGENGSGKTTLTKVIAKLLKPSAGNIVQAIDPTLGQKRATRDWFKTLAYVYQNPNYQLFMSTVEDELLFSAHSLEYCQKIVDMFELEPLLDSHPHSLSEGQKRKLSIAVMLAMKPRVLILDEPTVGQDFRSLEMMVNNLNKIHREERNTMITITHDQRCAEALCDKAIIVDNGEIVATGGKELVRTFFG